MVNIFNEITIIDKFFKNDPINLKIKTHDLWSYLYNNLENENYNLFRWEFKTALTINSNASSLDALNLDVSQKKLASFKENTNKLKYMQNSLTYLNQKS
jgi:hypothetical protein